MISLDKAVVARLVSHGHHFEIFVDPENARSAIEDASLLGEVVASTEVYKDVRKAERASEETLKEAFGTTEFSEVAHVILKKGEIQLTTEQRKKVLEEKRRKVIAMIAREGIDPKTNLPHPINRIEKAIDEAKVHIDPFKSAERQLEEVVSKIRPLLPIKFAQAKVAIKISAQYTGKAYGYLHGFKKIKEEWLDDGSLAIVIEIPAGLQTDIYDKLNSLTHGSVETKLLEVI